MKKAFLIGLAGLMLFAFTQCSGLKVSKQYKDLTNLMKDCEKTIDKASDCDELHNATLNLALGILLLDDYSEKEQMSQKEEDKLMKYADEVQKKYNLKAAIFGCTEDDE